VLIYGYITSPIYRSVTGVPLTDNYGAPKNIEIFFNIDTALVTVLQLNTPGPGSIVLPPFDSDDLFLVDWYIVLGTKEFFQDWDYKLKAPVLHPFEPEAETTIYCDKTHNKQRYYFDKVKKTLYWCLELDFEVSSHRLNFNLISSYHHHLISSFRWSNLYKFHWMS